jgi:hypothetical protein
VDAHHFAHRNGEELERVRLAEVLLAREGQAREIVERADAACGNASLVQPSPVERHPLVQVGDEPREPLPLKLAQPRARHRLELGLEDHSLPKKRRRPTRASTFR